MVYPISKTLINSVMVSSSCSVVKCVNNGYFFVLGTVYTVTVDSPINEKL